MTLYDPAAEGWIPMGDNPMPAGIGVPWRRSQGDRWVYGMLTRADHANPAGAVHGGVLAVFADHVLGCYVEAVADDAPNVTIQLNTHFLAAVEPGSFVELRGEVTRATSSMVFVRGIVSVGEGDVAAVDGIWRVFRGR